MGRRKLPTFLDDDEPERLLAATSRTRDRVLLLTFLLTGLRNAELCALRVEHIDFRKRSLWVRCGKGSKDRIIPLPKKLAGPLRGYLQGRQTGYVFPSTWGSKAGERAMSTRAVQKLVKRTGVRAKLRDATKPRRVRPHALRHAFCTRLLDSGVPVHAARDLMGHSSLTSTDVYSHCTPERLRAAIDSPYE
jgi:integrase/recombinase XerD